MSRIVFKPQLSHHIHKIRAVQAEKKPNDWTFCLGCHPGNLMKPLLVQLCNELGTMTWDLPLYMVCTSCVHHVVTIMTQDLPPPIRISLMLVSRSEKGAQKDGQRNGKYQTIFLQKYQDYHRNMGGARLEDKESKRHNSLVYNMRSDMGVTSSPTFDWLEMDKRDFFPPFQDSNQDPLTVIYGRIRHTGLQLSHVHCTSLLKGLTPS